MTKHKFDFGDTVRYHPIIGREDDGLDYTIIAKWALGHGALVYKLRGKSGCVAEEALSLAKKGERIAELENANKLNKLGLDGALLANKKLMEANASMKEALFILRAKLAALGMHNLAKIADTAIAKAEGE